MQDALYRFRETDAAWLSGELQEILDDGFVGLIRGEPLSAAWMNLIVIELRRQYGPCLLFERDLMGIIVSAHP